MQQPEAHCDSGLVASVAFHSRKTEGKTAGDLGIVFVRPDVSEGGLALSELSIKHEYKRGLLCQAKIFRRDSSWGGLTPPQKKNLPARLSYFSLLLYRYADRERRELLPFQWQLAGGATVEDIGHWLSSDTFPNLQASEWILRALVQNRIGTDDKDAIDQYIVPRLRPSLVIRVHWKDDGPGESIYLRKNVQTDDQQRLVQYRQSIERTHADLMGRN